MYRARSLVLVPSSSTSATTAQCDTVIVAREANAMTDARLLRRLPVRTCRDCADHVARPLIPEMTQTEINRIVAALDRQLIEKRFHR
jgi:hypothetical protein